MTEFMFAVCVYSKAFDEMHAPFAFGSEDRARAYIEQTVRNYPEIYDRQERMPYVIQTSSGLPNCKPQIS
jgi:hypothetical protein